MHRNTLFLIFASIFFTSAVFAQPYNPQGVQMKRRACSNDRFFIEVPQWESSLPTNFSARLTNNLATLLQNNRARWFCDDPGSFYCFYSLYFRPPMPRVVSVLPARGSHPLRTDGHTRFFRVFFETPTGDSIAPKPEAACEIIQHLRDQTSRIARGIAQPTCTPSSTGSCFQTMLPWVRVGRECAVAGLGIEGESLGTTLSEWPYQRIGEQPATPPDPNQTPITIALIDSGVPPALRGGLGVAYEVPMPTQFGHTPGSQFHPHGTRMAALIRRLAPYNELISFRALDENGHGDTAAIARAIDGALFDTQRTGPLIINLSFGFPPEMSRPAYVWDHAAPGAALCVTLEDGVGESIRYTLDVAQRLDADGFRPILAVGASGNRTQPQDQWAAFKTWPGLQYSSPCGSLGSASEAPASFFPAEYGHLLSCRPALPRTLVLSAGATDILDRPAVNSIVDAESFLVAPGEHVYAYHPSLGLDEVGMNCITQVGRAEGFEGPQALTGSSVSAAMVSAAAARAQTIAQYTNGPMDSGHISRLLYLTSERTCRVSRGLQVRRLSIDRLEHALNACPGLVFCAKSEGDPRRFVDAGLLARCQSELTACGLADGSGPCHRPSVNDFTWPDDYINRTLCTPGTAGCLPRDAPACFEDGTAGVSVPAAMPPQSFYERATVGSLGPQPDDTSCDECLMLVGWADTELFLELSEHFERPLTYEDPYLVVLDPARHSPRHIKLSRYTDPRDWAPGKTVVVKIPAGDLGFAPPDFETHKAILDVGLRTSPDKVARDISPLRIKIQ